MILFYQSHNKFSESNKYGRQRETSLAQKTCQTNKNKWLRKYLKITRLKKVKFSPLAIRIKPAKIPYSIDFLLKAEYT